MIGKLLKLIPLVGAVADLVSRFVNKPQAPKDSDAAKKAKERWEDAKRGL